ncbi:MAG TPA: SpoIIE family protein phosphatase [Bacteroidia bacterium]|nr:SpoIIE family protein phosphatase [Bacteroidia bacterium]
MKKHFLLFFIIVNSVLCFSQNRKIDSVYKSIRNERVDTSIIKSHINLCVYQIKSGDADSALSHGWYANKLAVKKNYTLGVIRSYNELGNAYFGVADYDSSIYCFKNALTYIKDKTIPHYFSATRGIGNNYFYLGDYINAFDYYLKYLKQAEISGTISQKAIGNSNVGVILKEQKKYDEALTYFNRTIKIGNDNSDYKTLFVGYSNKGNIYNEKAKSENKTFYNQLALDNYNKAKSALEKFDNSDYRSAIILLGNIGNVYADLNEYNKAVIAFNEATKLIDQSDFFPQSALIYNNLAGVYLDMNDFIMAEKYLKLGQEISIETQATDNLAQNYEYYAKYYESIGDIKNALKTYKLYKLYNDTLFNSENTERLKELELNVEFEKKESIKQSEQNRKDAITKEEKKKQNIIILSISVVLILVVTLAFFIFSGLKKQRKANQIISKQKEEVDKQKEIIEEHQKETIDSINYAKRIQYALLAQNSLLEKFIPYHFVFFNPKDIVSGDFYWATEHSNKFYLAVCDSTGHGVPGAFMSLLNIGFLSEAINENNITQPNEILNYVRQRLINSIGSDGQKDGMDAILVCLDKNTNTVTYAAANNEPILIKQNQIIELPKDKMPVGKGEKMESFSLFSIDISKGDVLYLYTDGYADQFGGPKGKKFKYKQLNDLLLEISAKSMNEQKEILTTTFSQWKGNLEQVDDVLLIGMII